MVEINGQQYQHATSSFRIISNGTPGMTMPLKTVKKVDFSVELPKENTNDSQGNVDGFVVKSLKLEGSITIKLSEWLNLVRPALSVSPGLLLSQFQYVQTYGQQLVNALHRVELIQCMIQKEAYSSEDSQDPDMMELPIIFQKILIDGQPPVFYDPAT